MRTSLRLLTVGLLLSLALPAWAGPPVTETNTAQGVVETFVDTPFCEPGATHEITTTTNIVEHATLFDDGREHFTFTQTGTFAAEPLDPSGQSATGHFTVWGGFNNNGKTVNGTFTFSINGSFQDGTKINLHAVDHFNVRPDGTENLLSRCRSE